MINFYYKTLFQETVRFLNEGSVKTARLGMQDLAASDRGHALSGYTPPERMSWFSSHTIQAPVSWRTHRFTAK